MVALALFGLTSLSWGAMGITMTVLPEVWLAFLNRLMNRCLASVLGDSGNDLGRTGSGYGHHHVSRVWALGGLRFHCRVESVYPSWVLRGFSNSAHANREEVAILGVSGLWPSNAGPGRPLGCGRHVAWIKNTRN